MLVALKISHVWEWTSGPFAITGTSNTRNVGKWRVGTYCSSLRPQPHSRPKRETGKGSILWHLEPHWGRSIVSVRPHAHARCRGAAIFRLVEGVPNELHVAKLGDRLHDEQVLTLGASMTVPHRGDIDSFLESNKLCLHAEILPTPQPT